MIKAACAINDPRPTAETMAQITPTSKAMTSGKDVKKNGSKLTENVGFFGNLKMLQNGD